MRARSTYQAAGQSVQASSSLVEACAWGARRRWCRGELGVRHFGCVLARLPTSHAPVRGSPPPIEAQQARQHAGVHCHGSHLSRPVCWRPAGVAAAGVGVVAAARRWHGPRTRAAHAASIPTAPPHASRLSALCRRPRVRVKHDGARWCEHRGGRRLAHVAGFGRYVLRDGKPLQPSGRYVLRAESRYWAIGSYVLRADDSWCGVRLLRVACARTRPYVADP